MSTDDLAAHVDALGYGRALERADLPADDVLAASLLILEGHPRLPAVADLLCSAADSLAVDPAALVSLCQAVLATKSPALFGDAVTRLLDCGPVLEAYGRQLAVELLAQAAAPATDASAQDVFRAADALEAATQLRVRGFASRFELFALLEAIGGPAEAPWSRAATRAIVTCVETWPEAAELTPSLERFAGTAAPEPAHIGPAQPNEQQESDFAVALARVEIVTALRADQREPALKHLERASRVLAPVQSEDERPDAEVLAAITHLLSDLILNGVLTDTSPVVALTTAVREHNWLSPGSTHWIGDRVAASNTAWAKLTRQLQAAQEQLKHPS